MIVPGDPTPATSPARLAVLGGCGGIGRELVTVAIRRGIRVAVLDLQASITTHPVPDGVSSYVVDATSPQSLASAFSQLEADWGALDGFVNLCGFMSDNVPVLETGTAGWGETIDGNLNAVFSAATHAIPLLAKGHGGSLVNTASGLASHTRPGYGAYAAAKAGVISLTKTLALENAPAVRVNAIAPAAVDTAFLRGGTGRSTEDGQPHVDIDAYTAMTPMQRMAVPADIVEPILFLLSDASQYMTGQVLWINGGNFMP